MTSEWRIKKFKELIQDKREMYKLLLLNMLENMELNMMRNG